MQEKRPITLVAMEDRLIEDKKGEYKKEILSLFHRHQKILQSKIQAGLGPDDFRRAESLQLALEEAEKAVRQFWNRFHQPA